MPEGIPNPHNKVCKIQKSLYGLKHASRQCFAKLTDFLKQQGYMQSKNDYSLFLKHTGSHTTVVAIYVDDILVMGSNIDDITTLKQDIHSTLVLKTWVISIVFWVLRSLLCLVVFPCLSGSSRMICCCKLVFLIQSIQLHLFLCTVN